MDTLPTIIVTTFNRPNSLRRLLSSLAKANYPQQSIRLLISIDYDDSVKHQQVCQLAERYHWKYGEKIVKRQPSSLGLKQHILTCGDLTEQYEQIILLEDDLYVSPHFYNYTISAFNYYQTNKKIAGISLYSYEICESLRLPFRPIPDNSDVYFLQVPSSWGQAWNRVQWQMFRNWLRNNNPNKVNELLYAYVRRWNPQKSWKRLFIAYLIDTDRYFVFPRQSLSTNFSDSGTNIHRTDNNHLYQVSLLFESKSFKFKPLSESHAIYDSFFEISPSALKQLHPTLQAYDFEVDLKGGKKQSELNKPYILTSKKGKNPILCFSNQMRPLETNIIFNLAGSSIQLFHKNDLIEDDYMNHKYKFKTFKYLDYHLYDAHQIEFALFKIMHPKYLWNVLHSKIVDKLKKYFSKHKRD